MWKICHHEILFMDQIFCSETKLHKFAFVVSKEKLKRGLCNGVKLDVYFPGFPTLKHIEHTVSLLQIYCVFLLH